MVRTGSIILSVMEDQREYLIDRDGRKQWKRTESLSHVIRSFLSLSFFRPANAILVPGMYYATNPVNFKDKTRER
jgi:hypothetical protein